MSDFIDFKKFLPKALEKYKVTREARAALICNRFREIAPGIIGGDSGDVKPKFFKGHVLYIAVPSSIWAQRVYVHRHDIIMKLNLEAGSEVVHDIRTVVE